ncbi:hypothetical protein BB561_004487 [Smittium simulii]|uniref:Acid phosphatase n=1 Tax=Smittium simulii TaxID=133385 RepID=A0A2T9YG46_9FUNG|nr:hypothetical protein BB561_004487 [Smittium simulii]
MLVANFLQAYIAVISATVIANPIASLETRDFKIDTSKYCSAPLLDSSKYLPVKDSELVFVQALFRHGARTPAFYINSIKNDYFDCSNPLNVITDVDGASPPNASVSMKQTIISPVNAKKSFGYGYWKGNCVTGQLTDLGKAQAKSSGSSFRKIYVDKLGYINDKLQSNVNISVRTTNIWRTKDTAMEFVSGVYPKDKRSSDAVITMGQLPQEIENMYDNTAICPKISEIAAKITKTAQYQDYLKKRYTDMIRIAGIIGLNTTDVPTTKSLWLTLFDSIFNAKCTDKPYACNSKGQCINDSDIELARDSYNFEQNYMRRDSIYAKEYTKLSTGPLLNDLLQDIKSAIDEDKLLSASSKSSAKRLSIFSAHDATISAVLSALNSTSSNIGTPPFMTMVLFEIWKSKSGEYSVRIMQDNDVVKVNAIDGEAKPWCNMNSCKFEDYSKYVSKFVYDDYEKECYSK